MSESYAKQLSKKQILELRSILSDLPPYVKDFMRSIETTTQPRTRIAYAHDIKYFFEFLQRATIATISIPDAIITLSIS